MRTTEEYQVGIRTEALHYLQMHWWREAFYASMSIVILDLNSTV